MESDKLFETVRRSAVDIFSEEGLKTRFNSGKPQKIKIFQNDEKYSFKLFKFCYK